MESHWLDVHADLVSLTRTTLNRILPEDLVARMEERIVIDSVDYAHQRAIYPDVRVYQQPDAGPTLAKSRGGLAVAEPILLEVMSEEHTETYITIQDPAGELVTVIEFLSLSNKLPAETREQYRRKRDELIAASVNLVEIDLVRQGSWRELLAPFVPPAGAETAYRAVVRRARPKLQVGLIPLPLRQPLPAIAIPLRPKDQDVVLDLGALVKQAYENGRYDRTDYTRPCQPPLQEDDAAWADELLQAAGLRHRA